MGSVREMAILWSIFLVIGVWQMSQINGTSARVQTIMAPEYQQSEAQLLKAVRSIKPDDWQAALPRAMLLPDGNYKQFDLPNGARWTLMVGEEDSTAFADITAEIEDGWFSDRQVWFSFALRPSRFSPDATAALNKLPMPADMVQITGDYMLGDILKRPRDHLPTMEAAQGGIAMQSTFVSGRYAKYMEMHNGAPIENAWQRGGGI
jgi:hypothetical protein